jgi:hypothetical protein
VRGHVGDADSPPAPLGERHPEVPVLVAAGKLPAAYLEHGLAPVERADRKVVLVADLPRVERRATAVDVLEVAEALDRAPRCSHVRVAVENGR